MKKIVLLLLFALLITNFVIAQSTGFPIQNPETYIETNLSKQQLNALSREYAIDKVTLNPDNTLKVRLCVSKKQYKTFADLNIPFNIVPQRKADVNMASTYSQMVSGWNRYPTYGAYLAMMDTFQTQFPDICKIDTILAQTPGGHSLLAAHISQDLLHRGNKPAFFYSSTIHGDEPVGYYFMLRLIHYLLNNYATNAEIRNLIDHVDIRICPIENPDGTYYSDDNTLNESPISTRTNHYGEDLNRSYPIAGGSMATTRDYQPEVEAMINFGTEHSFTMSANLHGGAEVFNYPWDTWSSSERPPADQDWWELVGKAFVDTCHLLNNFYMSDEYDGVTEGADWYYAEGSRQDCFNYYLGCREATIEVSSNKVLSSNQLPTYWNYIRPSLLHYMEESLNGLRGIVTDSITGAPIAATIFINNHDMDNSFTSSLLPTGNYHRPLKGGSYSVTYSAGGYTSKTQSITVADHQVLVHNVELVPIGYSVENSPVPEITVRPNPTRNSFNITIAAMNCDNVTLDLYNSTGIPVMSSPITASSQSFDIRHLPAGIYFAKITCNGKALTTKKIVKL